MSEFNDSPESIDRLPIPDSQSDAPNLRHLGAARVNSQGYDDGPQLESVVWGRQSTALDEGAMATQPRVERGEEPLPPEREAAHQQALRDRSSAEQALAPFKTVEDEVSGGGAAHADTEDEQETEGAAAYDDEKTSAFDPAPLTEDEEAAEPHNTEDEPTLQGSEDKNPDGENEGQDTAIDGHTAEPSEPSEAHTGTLNDEVKQAAKYTEVGTAGTAGAASTETQDAVSEQTADKQEPIEGVVVLGSTVVEKEIENPEAQSDLEIEYIDPPLELTTQEFMDRVDDAEVVEGHLLPEEPDRIAPYYREPGIIEGELVEPDAEAAPNEPRTPELPEIKIETEEDDAQIGAEIDLIKGPVIEFVNGKWVVVDDGAADKPLESAESGASIYSDIDAGAERNETFELDPEWEVPYEELSDEELADYEAALNRMFNREKPAHAEVAVANPETTNLTEAEIKYLREGLNHIFDVGDIPAEAEPEPFKTPTASNEPLDPEAEKAFAAFVGGYGDPSVQEEVAEYIHTLPPEEKAKIEAAGRAILNEQERIRFQEYAQEKIDEDGSQEPPQSAAPPRATAEDERVLYVKSPTMAELNPHIRQTWRDRLLGTLGVLGGGVAAPVRMATARVEGSRQEGLVTYKYSFGLPNGTTRLITVHAPNSTVAGIMARAKFAMSYVM